MTTESHELALTEINNGDRYDIQCSAARMSPSAAAGTFHSIASAAAREYEHEFPPSEGGRLLTAEDILLAAAELAEYYANHIRETDALESA